VAPTDCVCTDQRDNLLVVEAGESTISMTKAEERVETIPHTVKDVSDMRSALGGIGKAAIRGGVLGESVDSSRPPRDFGSGHLLDGSNASKSPQVSVADPGEFSLDSLHQGSGDREAVIGIMERLGFKPHGSIVAIHFTKSLELYGEIRSSVYSPSTSTGVFVIRSRRMPGKSKKYWAVGTVVVPSIASIIQNIGNLEVDLETPHGNLSSTRDKDAGVSV